MRGVTNFDVWLSAFIKISTHTPHARRDSTPLYGKYEGVEFQLTRLMRGVTSHESRLQTRFAQFQLTRLMRGVTQCAEALYNVQKISTHTPHARRDIMTKLRFWNDDISTHTPHARRDNNDACAKCAEYIFQLTRLMRGVTSQKMRRYSDL